VSRKNKTFWTVATRTAAVLVATGAILFGGRAVRNSLPVAIRATREDPFPPQFRQQMEIVLRSLPPGAAVLHLSSVEEIWYSRMWERALYPQHAVVCLHAGGLDPARIRRVSQVFATQYAITVGAPPPDPGYRWIASLGRLPGLREESWFGELNP
jgi:hypothetical protein